VLCNCPSTPVRIMRRGESVSAQVFKKLFPRPIKNFDPPTWNSHIRTNLVPELQKEIRRFYDELSPVEVRYPGINYAHPHHRRRLNCNSFPHHQRLFKVMDHLGLTEPEIVELCNWDLTLCSRRKFEREHNVKIVDTTGDIVPTWAEVLELSNLEGDVDADEDEVKMDEQEDLEGTPKGEHRMEGDSGGSDQVNERMSAELSQVAAAGNRARELPPIHWDFQWDQQTGDENTQTAFAEAYAAFGRAREAERAQQVDFPQLAADYENFEINLASGRRLAINAGPGRRPVSASNPVLAARLRAIMASNNERASG